MTDGPGCCRPVARQMGKRGAALRGRRAGPTGETAPVSKGGQRLCASEAECVGARKMSSPSGADG